MLESRLGRSIQIARRNLAAPIASAALAINALVHPVSVQAAPEEPKRDIIRVYPQCGGSNIPANETVMVVVSFLGDDLRFGEYSVGPKPDECGNGPAQASSMVAETFYRSESTRPDILGDATRPIDCPKWARGFKIDRITGVDGIDFEPASGDIHEGNQPDIRLKVHTDLITDGSYFTIGQVYCETPEGHFVTAVGTLNFATQIKP